MFSNLRMICSEFTGSAFPLFDEVKRFFDCELKGVGCEQGSDKRVRFHHITGNARIENVFKYQSCMVSK